MHSTAFHFPFLPLFYKITSLSAPDVLSICNPIFQLKANYTFIQLSSKPVTEADINFEWVVISGAEPLELVGGNTATPVVVSDPTKIIDTVFRVYIDRGTEDEFFADMTVFRTPTETTTDAGTFEASVFNLTAPMGVNSVQFRNSFQLNLLSPDAVETIPSISSTFMSTSMSQEIQDITSFTAVVSHSKQLLEQQHKVNNIKAYDPKTGILIASTNFSTNLIEIPIDVSVFYLVFDVTLNYYNPNKANKDVTISDSQVRSSYLSTFNVAKKYRNIVITEGIATAVGDRFVTGSYSDLIRILSLPQSKAVMDSLSVSGTITGTASQTNKLVTVFTPRVLAPIDVQATVVGNRDAETFISDYVLTRFNGISIGG